MFGRWYSIWEIDARSRAWELKSIFGIWIYSKGSRCQNKTPVRFPGLPDWKQTTKVKISHAGIVIEQSPAEVAEGRKIRYLNWTNRQRDAGWYKIKVNNRKGWND